MRKIKRNIRERIIGIACNMACRLEESIGNVSSDLVSNYDMGKFFVRNFTRVVVAVEWVVIEMRRWLEFVERNEMFKGCDFLDDDNEM